MDLLPLSFLLLLLCCSYPSSSRSFNRLNLFAAVDFAEGTKPTVVGWLDAEDSFFAGSVPRFTKEPPLFQRTLPASESAAVFDRLSFKTCLEGTT